MHRVGCFFWILVLGFAGLTGRAQNLSPVFASGNATVDTLCAQAKTAMLQDPDNFRALALADSAKQIAEATPLATAKANATLSWIFLDNKNFPLALEYAERAQQTLKGKKAPDAIGKLHHQRGIILDELSRPKEAVREYLAALDYYQENKLFEKEAQVAGEIGRLHLITRDFPSARSYLDRQFRILEVHPNDEHLLTYYNRYGSLLLSEGKAKESLHMAQAGLELARKRNLKKHIPNFYYDLAGAWFESGYPDTAMRYVDSAIGYSVNHQMPAISFIVGKGQILESEGKNAEAEKLYRDYIEAPETQKEKYLEMQARVLLQQFYEKVGDPVKAAQQMLVANRIKDSISSSRQAIALKEVEYKYQDEEKEALLESYRTSARLKNGLIAAALLILGFTLFQIFTIRRSLKLKQTLFDKKEKLLEAERQKALIEKELEKQQKEKALLNQQLAAEEQQRLEQEKAITDRELATITLYVQEKNRMLEDLQSQLNRTLQETQGTQHEELKRINRHLRQSINFDADWDKIKMHFEKVHPEFFARLAERCPQLTQNELKHCAYIRMNLSNKETANLLNVDYNAVKMSRYRIKKKLNLAQEEDLAQFIIQV